LRYLDSSVETSTLSFEPLSLSPAQSASEPLRELRIYCQRRTYRPEIYQHSHQLPFTESLFTTNQITENELPIRKQRQIGHRHSNKKQDITRSDKSQIETNITQQVIAIATTATNINREQQSRNTN